MSYLPESYKNNYKIHMSLEERITHEQEHLFGAACVVAMTSVMTLLFLFSVIVRVLL